jgi:hypothetical protein
MGLVCRKPFWDGEIEHMLAWIAEHVPHHVKGNAFTSRIAPTLFQRMCSDVCSYSVTNILLNKPQPL